MCIILNEITKFKLPVKLIAKWTMIGTLTESEQIISLYIVNNSQNKITHIIIKLYQQVHTLGPRIILIITLIYLDIILLLDNIILDIMFF